MEKKGQRSDCSVEMNHRSESGGKGMNASDQIKTEIKTEPMDEGNATSDNSATVKGEFSGVNMWYKASRLESSTVPSWCIWKAVTFFVLSLLMIDFLLCLNMVKKCRLNPSLASAQNFQYGGAVLQHACKIVFP